MKIKKPKYLVYVNGKQIHGSWRLKDALNIALAHALELNYLKKEPIVWQIKDTEQDIVLVEGVTDHN